jgi:hypothetical protein
MSLCQQVDHRYAEISDAFLSLRVRLVGVYIAQVSNERQAYSYACPIQDVTNSKTHKLKFRLTKAYFVC